jgi:hypothetical protein
MGGGRGWRHQYYATGLPGWARGYRYGYQYPYEPSYEPDVTPAVGLSQADELVYLKQQARSLRKSLQDIDRRIDELQKETRTEQRNEE